MSTVHALISGRPGAGKTTVVKRTCDLLLQQGYSVCGFYTDEVRLDGARIGFDVVSLAGGRSVLARTDQQGHTAEPRLSSAIYVGQYRVDLKSFEKASLASLADRMAPNSVTVIDEIGKMELKSEKFGDEVRRVFADPRCVVLATVPGAPGAASLPLVRDLMRRPEIRVFKITADNRDVIPTELAIFLKTALSSK